MCDVSGEGENEIAVNDTFLVYSILWMIKTESSDLRKFSTP
jgi:hypothetical protein